MSTRSSLGTRLALVLGLLASGTALMAWSPLRAAWQASHAATLDSLGTTLAGHLNAAAGWQAIERGTANTVLNGAGTPSADLLTRLEAVREKGDAEVQAARTALTAYLAVDADADVAASVRRWQDAFDRFAEARRQVDQRQITPAEWFAAATATITAEFLLRDAAFAPVTPEQQVRYYNGVLRTSVAALAEYAGRERATVGAAIASGRPIPPDRLKALIGFRAIVENNSERILAVRGYATTPPELAAAIDQYRSAFLVTYESLRQAVYAASEADGDARPYPVTAADWIARSTTAIDSALEISNVVGTLAATSAERTKRAAHWAEIGNLSLLGGLLGTFVGIAIFVRRRITAPLGAAASQLEAGTRELEAMSRDIASSSQRLTQTSDEQARHVASAREAVDELAQQATSNARSAEDVSGLAHQAQQQTERAGEAMRRVTAAMSELHESTRQVRGILHSIDQIALQTHLLALNAAVESARAGEHGQGFAIVAEQVRELARRSAAAAEETTTILERSLSQATQSVETVTLAAHETGAIADVAATVTLHVATIASSSKQQVEQIERIRHAMNRLDALARSDAEAIHNAAAASEETNATAAELEGVAAELRAVVHGQRQTGHGQNGTSPPSRRVPTPAGLQPAA